MATVRETIQKVDAIRDNQRAKIEDKWNATFDMNRFAKEGVKYAQEWARMVLMPETTKTLNEAMKEAKK